MKANGDKLLSRLAQASRRDPLVHVTAPPWLAKILVAGGAVPLRPDYARNPSDLTQPIRPKPATAEEGRVNSNRTKPKIRPPTPRDTAPERARGASDEPDDEFGAFFRHEYPKVVKAVMFAGAERRDAEEAATNAMIEAYLSWPLLEDPAVWVRILAIRNCVGSASSDTPRPVIDTFAHPGDRTLVDAAGGVESGDECQKVRAAVGCLSPAQREIVALDAGGYDSTKIAEALRKPMGSVRSNLRRAHDRLEDYLE